MPVITPRTVTARPGAWRSKACQCQTFAGQCCRAARHKAKLRVTLGPRAFGPAQAQADKEESESATTIHSDTRSSYNRSAPERNFYAMHEQNVYESPRDCAICGSKIALIEWALWFQEYKR